MYNWNHISTSLLFNSSLSFITLNLYFLYAKWMFVFYSFIKTFLYSKISMVLNCTSLDPPGYISQIKFVLYLRDDNVQNIRKMLAGAGKSLIIQPGTSPVWQELWIQNAIEKPRLQFTDAPTATHLNFWKHVPMVTLVKLKCKCLTITTFGWKRGKAFKPRTTVWRTRVAASKC